MTDTPAQPRAERPIIPPDYGMPASDEGMLAWSWAEQRLVDALNYWVITVDAAGRPHASPVWGAWHQGGLYLEGSSQTRRVRNMEAHPAIAVHLESGDEVLILEGDAVAVGPAPDRTLTTPLAAIYSSKYAVHDYAPGPEQWDAGGLYVLRPQLAYGWTFRPDEQFGLNYTRWRFD